MTHQNQRRRIFVDRPIQGPSGWSEILNRILTIYSCVENPHVLCESLPSGRRLFNWFKGQRINPTNFGQASFARGLSHFIAVN